MECDFYIIRLLKLIQLFRLPHYPYKEILWLLHFNTFCLEFNQINHLFGLSAFLSFNANEQFESN